MGEVASEPRITWGNRDFATNMSAAATREESPPLAQLLNRLAELAQVKGLWHEDTLKHLYGLAGCLLALDRPADAMGAADLLSSKQAGRLQWGEMYESNAQALRAHASALLGNRKASHQAKRLIGRPMPGSDKEIASRWNETLRSYRADAQRMRDDRNGLDFLLEAGHIQANAVKSLLAAPPNFAEKVSRGYDEIKTALSQLLEKGAASRSKPMPVKPGPNLGTPTLPPAFQPKAADPKLVREFKDRIRKHPSFKSEPILQMILDLSWMLYALERAEEAVAVIEAVLDYHQDDEKFVFNTEEGMQAVKLAALLRKRLGGGARLEKYRVILDKLQDITEQVRLRNKSIDRSAPDPRYASRRVLEEIVPKGLAQARAEARRVMSFGRLRTSLDKVAMALVRESYAGLPAERIRRYLADGLEQYRERIEKGQ
jgi:hypothetical protein